MKTLILAFAFALALTGCTADRPPTQSSIPVIATPAIAAPASQPAFFARGLSAFQTNGWDRLLARAIADLGGTLTSAVPEDAASYCPGYSGMTPAQRSVVWQNLFIALTRFESNYIPTVSFNETDFDPRLVERNGDPVISRGLLQISIGSANGYMCRIEDAQQLHDPETNLRCAVRIASRWVQRDGVITGGTAGAWRGMARYWSPFRRDDSRNSIMQSVRSSPGC